MFLTPELRLKMLQGLQCEQPQRAYYTRKAYICTPAGSEILFWLFAVVCLAALRLPAHATPLLFERLVFYLNTLYKFFGHYILAAR